MVPDPRDVAGPPRQGVASEGAPLNELPIPHPIRLPGSLLTIAQRSKCMASDPDSLLPFVLLQSALLKRLV